MKDVVGTFTSDDDLRKALEGTTVTDVYLYGPADLPWWKDWAYRIAGRLFGTPYPEVVIAHGAARLEGVEVDEATIGVTFRADGEWEVE